MVYEEIYIQLLLIIIGMVIFSLLLNKVLGISPQTMKQIREKATNLRERIENAQILGDMILMRELQSETMRLMKLMMKKQLVPMCLRCFIFIGIWIVLSFFYGRFGPESGFFFGFGWVLYYFVISLSLSFGFMGIRFWYKKATGKEGTRTSFMKEISQILNFSALNPSAGTVFQMPSRPATAPQQNYIWKNRIQSTSDWKDRIQTNNETDNKSPED